MVDQFNPNQVDITLTESAIQHFKHYLAQHPEAVALRFSVKKAGCSGLSYSTDLIDAIADTDVKIPAECPLVVDQGSLVYLNGLVIDYVKQSLGQAKIVYLNPNEEAKCGCGVSFSFKKNI
jgi:iron-sulfur cluster assembly protein